MTRVNIVWYLVELCVRVLLTASCHIVQEQGLDTCGQSQHRFRTGHQVKGHGERPPLLEVGEPEFGPSKLPLDICVILKRETNRLERKEGNTNPHLHHMDFET